MASVHEQLSEQFYKWESRGRGWQVFGEPVAPEPPFQFFRGYRLPDASVVDDGRKPTFLSSLFRKPTPPPVVEEVEEEPEPTPLVRDSLVEFQASLPAKLDIAKESFDQFFHNLALCREPIAFELLGIHKRVLAQFAASVSDASPVRRQLAAHFPDVQFRQLEGALDKAWDESTGDEAFAVEFGLEREFMLPLTTGKMDPFVGLVGALAELQPGELALFQILWQPVQNPWAESLINSVTLPDGKPLFVNAAELAGAAENKAAKPLYAAVVRIMGRASSRARLEEIARDMAGSLRVFSNPQGNALIPLNNDDYPYEEHLEDVLRRQSRRTGIILNGDELTGFVHLPTSAVRSPALQRDAGLTKAAPASLRQATDFVIGDNEHNGETVPVFLTADQRVRHTHIIGSNGTGKSSLLLNLIRQDIENGDGVAVLDPHGDLIDQILGCIPEERINDVVLVDPSDVEFPIGFNILQAHSEEEKRLIASDLVGVFRRLATSWGDQMDTVLQNAILVILESSRGGTLADLRRFLLEPVFRTEFLATVQDPELIYYWEKVFPRLGGGKSIGSVLTRLQDFFSQKPLRNMVSQRDNRLKFADIMDGGKIFLAKLSEGLCGEENSYLLGTLLMSKFQQLAMARQAQKQDGRRDFWLYIDEFQHFITPSMAKILTGARKYRLGLTLAHQELHQLQSDPKVASAVLTQPCAKSRGWEVKELYNLAGQSGKAVMQNPEARRMMKDIERGHITGLVFSKLARLSRNRRELEDFSDFFKKHDADLISLSEAIDTSTAGGRMFFHLLGVFAQWEREEITERVNASVLTRAKLGKSINGTSPFGYEWKDRKLVIKPEEAAIRRKAYELFLKYRRKGQVAKELNAAGYRTRKGNIWRDTSIERILNESSAKGVYVFNTMRMTGSWRTELKPESEWGRAECPPIVSEDLWNQVNRIIEEQLKAWKKPGKPPVHLFSGLAHCSCGHKMYVAANSPKYFCRKCCNKIAIVDLENVILLELKKFFGQPGRIASHLQAAEKNLEEKSALLATHQREIQKVREEMHQMHQLYLQKQISGDGFRDLYTPAEERLKQLNAGLPQLEAEVDFLKVNKLSADDVLNESHSLHKRWPKMPMPEKRQNVEALIEKIIIGNGTIDITYSSLPTSIEQCKSQQGLGFG